MRSSTPTDRSSKRKRDSKYSPDRYEDKKHKRDSKDKDKDKDKRDKKSKKDKKDKRSSKSKEENSHRDSEKDVDLKEKEREREREKESESKEERKSHETNGNGVETHSEKSVNDTKQKSKEDSDRSKDKDKDKDKDKEKERDKDKDKDKDREKDKEKEREKEKEKPRDRRDRDKERERDREREEKDRRERTRVREQNRDRRDTREKDSHRDRERDRDREQRDSHRDRDRDSHRDRDRDDKDKERDRRRSDDHHHRSEKDKEKDEKRVDEDKKRQLEKNEEQEKLEDEMRKRRERVEAWRLERAAKQQQEQEKKRREEEEAKQESPPKPSWSLEDDDDEEEKLLREASSSSSSLPQSSTNGHVPMDTDAESDLKKETDEVAQAQTVPDENSLTPSAVSSTSSASTSVHGQAPPPVPPPVPVPAPAPAPVPVPAPTPAPAAVAEEEEDPLESFMMGIKEEVLKLQTLDASKLLALNKANAIKKVSPEEKAETYSDDEDYGVEEEETDDSVPNWKKKKTLAPVDHTKIEYPPFKKVFYIEVPEIAKMSEEEVKLYRKSLDDIKIRGKDCPKPIKSFTQCGLSDRVLDVIKKLKFEKPTSIQAQAIPAIMSGRDIIGIAKTGSGKTLAFLLPMLRHILDQPPLLPGEGPIGLVLAPTRELAMQIHADFKKFCKAVQLKCACVYGGAGVANQIGDLKRGAEIVVCTPGRMIDMLCTNNGRITNLKRVTFVVLDEADRMFDLGFEPQITKILENVRPERQTVMFSATFPKQVESAARRTLEKRSLEIVVGGRSIVCSEVTQMVEVLSEDQKLSRLFDLFADWYLRGSILVFVDRQEAADSLFSQIVQSGIPCLSLHGGKDQLDRDCTIADFKAKVKTVLVATSVAARGLDVKDLQLVINYDVPNHYEDYVHRVGRTGRAGNKGTSITFITHEEERFAPDLVKALESSDTPVPQALRDLYDEFMNKKKEGQSVLSHGSGYGGKGYKFDEIEAAKRQEEKKRQKKAWGVEEDEEEEAEEVTEEEERTQTDGLPTDTVFSGSVPRDINSQAINQVLGGISKQPMSAQVHTAVLKAQQLAQQLNSSIKQPGIPAKAHFDAELEINDFPQQARWKVTHKDALSSITEWTGAAITTRGTYVPSGRPSPGERKLYLYIEGPTEHSVKTAKAEIKRILEEAAAQAPPERFGKYLVV